MAGMLAGFIFGVIMILTALLIANSLDPHSNDNTLMTSGVILVLSVLLGYLLS